MWEAWARKGYPKESLETIYNSLSQSTAKQYDSSFHAWWLFCKQTHVDIYNATVSDVLLFLQQEFTNNSRKYGTLNQHRSALSLLLPGEIGKSILLRRFFKGVYRLRPPKAKYNVIWNPQVVLHYLTSLGRNSDLPLLLLSKKLATLIALGTGHRLQTIHAIKVIDMDFGENGVKIYITDLLKTSKLNTDQPCLELHYFTDSPNLCVVSALLSYIERTADLRSPEDQYLFIRSQKPYIRASRATISRWIKQILQAAGINTSVFSAYSTRHSAVSAAWRNGASWDVIRKTAGWTADSLVFARFYNRPLQAAHNFTEAVFKNP